MITPGLPVYIAVEPVDMRFGYERLGGIVRERMRAEPRSRACWSTSSNGPSRRAALAKAATSPRKHSVMPSGRRRS